MFIGIVLRDESDYKYVKSSYIKCLKNEAIPLFLIEENVDCFINKCNGFILPGGDKFSIVDKKVIKYALDNDVPLLGICLGMQALACFDDLNDTFIDLTKINNNNFHNNKEKYSHEVTINEDTLLYKIIKKKKIFVNSRHNYHVETIKSNFIVSSFSKDGIMEGLESTDKKFVVGVQWHPEDMIGYDKDQNLLITRFLDECKRR